jgi:pimeloyl-ACP methyl ester carboxylesterase
MTKQSGFPDLDDVEHRFVELPGRRMHVAEAGRGEPLLLLHGFPQHWWGWYKVLPALAHRYRVIAPDLRGAGWTDVPAAGYTSEQLVADVVALLDVLELDRVRVMAHDWAHWSASCSACITRSGWDSMPHWRFRIRS